MLISETSKKVASNTFYQVIGKLFTMFATILVTAIITRTFGRAGYGEFSIMQNFPAFFFIIADFGFNAIAAKELVKNWEKSSEYLSNLLVLRTLISFVLIVFAGILLLGFPYSPALKFGTTLCLFLILTQALFATTNIIFQVKHRYDLSTIGNISGSFLILVLVGIFSYFRSDITLVSFSYVIGGILTFIVNMYFIKKLGFKLSLAVNKRLWKDLFVQSAPIGLMFIFSQVNFRADSILLSFMKLPSQLGLNNTESVAVYGLPYKIFEVLLVIPTFFMNAVYPVFVKSAEEGAARLKDVFKKSIVVLLAIGLVFSFAGIVLSQFFISVLGGAEFQQSVAALKILLTGMFVFYLSQPVAWLIVTLDSQKRLPVIYFIGAVFSVGMNLLLIPVFSFYASAVLTWVSEIIILILLSFVAFRSWKRRYA